MIRTGIGAALWMSGIFILGFMAHKTQFEIILAGYSLAFTGYMVLSKDFLKRSWLLSLTIIAVLGRIILSFSIPLLSDDIYRFIWDAKLQLDGLPLLSGTPRQLLEDGLISGAMYEELFPYLNSKDYYTVYPTLVQWLNRIALLVGGGDQDGFLTTLRAFHWIADIIAMLSIYKLADRTGFNPLIFWWYIFNPLLIVECTGNLHYEGIAIPLLLLSFVFIGKNNFASALSLSSSIIIKLNPALLIPLLTRIMSIRKGIAFTLMVLGISVTGLWVGFGEDVLKLNHSISLYFQSFEFNAGPYYLIRELGYFITGYNAIAVIGPALSALALIFILGIAFQHQSGSIRSAVNAAFLSYLAYLLLSTTIHPWYVLFLVAFGIFTKWKPLAIIWSFTVIFSYSHYWDGDIGPKWGWIMFEFIVLIISYVLIVKSPVKD